MPDAEGLRQATPMMAVGIRTAMGPLRRPGGALMVPLQARASPRRPQLR